MGRARLVLAVVVLAVGGVAVAGYLRMRDEETLSKAVNDVADAAVEASAKVAKGKPAPKKKKTGRSAKTRVVSRSGFSPHAPAPHTAPPHPAAPHSPAPISPGPDPFGQPDEDHGSAAPAPPRVHHRHYGPPSGASYESALGGNNQQIHMGASSGADLSDAQLSGPMNDTTFIDECGAPEDMGITVKVAIRMGRPVGVSVATSPHSANVANCIDHHIRGLSWPASPKMDSFVTTY